MKTRFLACLLAILMITFAICGCTPAAKQGTDQPASNDGEAIVLNFPCIWVGADSKAEVFGTMVEGFNKEYEGKYFVKIEDQTDYDAYNDKIRTQISTGNAPDIFTIKNQADCILYSQSGKLMDLTEFLAEEEIASAFNVGSVDQAKVDGVNHVFPYEIAVVPIMFNTKLLTEVGVESVPTSYEELWAACEKLKANGLFPTSQSTNDNAWFSMMWYSYALASVGGADVMNQRFDDQAHVEAAKIMQKMFEYTASDAIGGDASVANGHFFNERTACYSNGTWIFGRIKSEGVEGLYDNLYISPSLSFDGNNSGAYLRAVQASFAAAKQDDPAKEEAVKAFFRYILDPEKVVELANSSGAMFDLKMDDSKITDPYQQKILADLAVAPFTISYFHSVAPTPVANAFPAALEALIIGDITPEEFAKTLQEANDK